METVALGSWVGSVVVSASSVVDVGSMTSVVEDSGSVVEGTASVEVDVSGSCVDVGAVVVRFSSLVVDTSCSVVTGSVCEASDCELDTTEVIKVDNGWVADGRGQESPTSSSTSRVVVYVKSQVTATAYVAAWR